MELGLCGTELLHVGTHQARAIYGVLGQLDNRRVTDGRFGGNGPRYGRGPFQAFRLSVNTMRSMVLSSDVPVQPWIPHKGYEKSLIRESDLYQEMLFHVGLCNPDVFLYWNAWPRGENPGFSRDRVVDDCLRRLTELVGAADRRTLVRELAPWDGAYLLSGMNAGGRSVWRFTPDLPDGVTREGSLVRESPPVFRVGDVEVTIPGGRVHRPEREVSTVGYWVVAGLDAGPAVTRSSQHDAAKRGY